MIAVWLTLALASPGSDLLDRGSAALAEFQIPRAVALLERAVDEAGALTRDDHARLYEQLGIAYAYAGREADAISAFDRMLAIDPARALSYSLSPKATLVFERAREQARARRAPAVDLGLPRGREVDDSLPIDVDVLEDPLGFMKTAELFHRVGAAPWRSTRLPLSDPTGRHRAVLPPPSPPLEEASALEVHLVVYDDRGRAVYEVGSEAAPREVLLGYSAPVPWYQTWWVWTAATAVVVVATTVAVVVATRPEDPFIDFEARVAR